jgi:hypothetical protein
MEKVFRVAERLVRAEPEDADGRPVVLNDRRHGRRDHVGAVRPDEKIDFVHSHELGIDCRRIGRAALIVVADKLDRPAKKTAIRVHVVTPDLETSEHLLAGRRCRPGQAEAHADADGIGGIGRRNRNHESDEGRRTKRQC